MSVVIICTILISLQLAVIISMQKKMDSNINNLDNAMDGILQRLEKVEDDKLTPN